MEAIIKKYDYSEGTEEDESTVSDELREVEEEAAEKMNLAAMKKIMETFTKKICVKKFGDSSSPSKYMSSRTLDVINDVMDTCIENGKLKKTDCEDMVFELLLNVMKVGPMTGHTEVVDAIYGMSDLNMEDYLKELRGPKFKSLIDVFKGFTHTPETHETMADVSVEDQARYWGDCTEKVVQSILGEEETRKAWEPEIHKQIMDLYLFYFLQSDVLPQEYVRPLDCIMEKICYAYDGSDFTRNPYAEVDAETIRHHMKTIEKVAIADGNPKSEKHLDLAGYTFRKIIDVVKANESLLIELWMDFNNVLKTLALAKNALKNKELIVPFGRFFGGISGEILQKNPKLIASWAPVFAETVEKADFAVVDFFAETASYHIYDKCTPAKGDTATWIPVFKALMRHPMKDTVKVVARTLSDGKFKKIWEWKKNWEHGRDLITFILQVSNLPTEEGKDYFANRNVMSEYEDIVETLMEQYKILKISDKIAVEIMELCIGLMEKRSDIINKLPRGILCNVPTLGGSLQAKLPGIVKRFEVLLVDPDYPWTISDTDTAGEYFVEKFLESYKTGTEIQDEVNQSFIKMFTYCIEGDVEYVEMEHGNPTIYARILSRNLYTFFELHIKSEETKPVLAPLIPLVFQLLENQDEPELQKRAESTMSAMGQAADILAGYTERVVSWYTASGSVQALSTLFAMFRTLQKEDLECNFQELFAACQNDKENTTMQIAMFLEIGKKSPEEFSADHIKCLITDYLDDVNMKTMVLMTLDEVAADNAEKFPFELTMKAVFHDVKFDENNSYYIAKLATSLGLLNESNGKTAIDELVAMSKTSKQPIYGAMLLNALKTLIGKYGKKTVEKHKPYFEDLKQNAEGSEIKEAATQIIDFLEGRSLEIVSTEVKETKKEVKVLDKKVTKNTKEIAGVKTQVVKNTKGVELVKGSLHGVKKRVDKVEDDLEETNIKVEEIDNKTMTNAPAWSRDLTKLMNPQTEHDWRLLASRLGYSNDDIRGWATQHDPCMALLSEWYATHKTIEATYAVLTNLQEMNREDGAAIVENAMKNVEGIVEEAPDYATPPPIFLSYQWGHQEEVKLLRNHLQMAGYECWMDIGQMGGGDKLFEKIDNGIRGAKLIISCVSEKYAKSPNCNREVNLSVNLGKPIIPLLMEKMNWPPRGSMGPIFSEYLFVRFFQRAGEETKDQRYWPVPKFQELLMQINLEHPPDDTLVTKEYKEWWKPMVEEIIIVKKDNKGQGSSSQAKPEANKEEETSPDVFISYQWGKQPQIKQLYRRLTELGFSCWMDIYQMGGGDSLYDKIDRGVRGCKVVLNCVTSKYSLSANCRREVSLADSLKKPLIPLLMEKIDWPPIGPMSMVFTQLLFINFYRDENIQMTWKGEKFDELLAKISENGVGETLMIQNDDTNNQSENQPAGAEKSVNKSAPIKRPNEKKDKISDAKTSTPDSKKPTTDPKKTTPEPKKPVPETEKSTPEAKNSTPQSKISKPISAKQTSEANKPTTESKKPTPEPKKSTPQSKTSKSTSEGNKPTTESKKPTPEPKTSTQEANRSKIASKASTPVRKTETTEPKKPTSDDKKPKQEAAKKSAPEPAKPTPEPKKSSTCSVL